MKKIDRFTLRVAQKKMLGILTELDRVCRENNINYWLEAGTLLGAYRHSGFIPWDDDVDIGMLRADYDTFLEIAPENFKNEYFVQTPETDKSYFLRNIPCKIRLNGTKITEEHELMLPRYKLNYNRGLFVDIFPMDKYSKNHKKRILQRLFSKFYYLKTISYFPKYKNPFLTYLSKIMIIFPWSILDSLKKILTKNLNNTRNELIGFGCEVPLDIGFCCEKDLFPLKEIEFEGKSFFAPKDTPSWLKTRYGKEYMELPSEEKRVWHAIDIQI